LALKPQVFSEQVVVFTLDSMSAFATLQSRVHEAWVRLLTSTMGEGLRYSATDCFDTFPFPASDPRKVIDSVEAAGRNVEAARAKYMVDENVGLTVTYNRLKDPACEDPRIVDLRKLHEDMDRALLMAYADRDPTGRWGEVDVPPFCPTSDDGRTRLDLFEDMVIDRLFDLNSRRFQAAQPEPRPAAGRATRARRRGGS
jgi:hypothetical protein